ncbi:MAG: hypothetical protein MUD12_16160, partial [Spirochaetes bacterium]|nr:hypothetical protein [Spirochaetota bacterium]
MGKEFIIRHKPAVVIAVSAACCLLAASVQATIVKTSLTGLLGKLTPVPASAQDAYGKCVKTGESQIKVKPAIESIGKQIEDMMKESAIPYGMENLKSMKNMKNAKVPKGVPTEDEFNNMSQEEKIAAAMKISKEMGYGPGLQDRPSGKNTEAWGKCIKLANEFTSLATDTSLATRVGEASRREEDAHKKIDEETSAACNSCPVLTSGESSAPDPKCVKAKKLAGADKHIAAANAYLKQLKEILAWHTGRVKPLIVQAEQLL